VPRIRLQRVAAGDPLPRRYRWYGVALLVVLVVLVAWNARPRWANAAIHSVTVDGARLVLLSDACGTNVRADVEEREDAVTITVRVRELRDTDCVGIDLPVVLDTPLGDRVLVDGSDDADLTCEPRGAAIQECVR
jgi:hypothetical protein